MFPFIAGNAALQHQPPQVAIGADVIEAVVVNAYVAHVRRHEGDGAVATDSVDVIETVSLLLIEFQFASTALTVTAKAVPAVCAVGVPVLPVVFPGMAVSPGTSNCNFAKAPAITVIGGLV